jgi:hypothetical protein
VAPAAERDAIVGAFCTADPEPPRARLGPVAPEVGATVLPEVPFATTDGVLVTECGVPPIDPVNGEVTDPGFWQVVHVWPTWLVWLVASTRPPRCPWCPCCVWLPPGERPCVVP